MTNKTTPQRNNKDKDMTFMTSSKLFSQEQSLKSNINNHLNTCQNLVIQKTLKSIKILLIMIKILFRFKLTQNKIYWRRMGKKKKIGWIV